MDEVPQRARETIETAANKTRVVTNTYEVNKQQFDAGLAAFRNENYVLARDQFAKADPESRDANTQFYIAYSFYRQGWGRFSNDDELFAAGLKQLDKVDADDKNFISDDSELNLRTPAELRNEFNEGLRITADDFNPLKLTRERK